MKEARVGHWLLLDEIAERVLGESQREPKVRDLVDAMWTGLAEAAGAHF